jgi:hypothetical protein
MIVTVWGTNYEGAHFRGFESDTDNTPVMINLTGNSLVIGQYILENFSYGSNDEGINLDTLVRDYVQGGVPQWDGCGGVARIAIDGVEVFREEEAIDHFNERTPWLDLGTINVDEVDDVFDHLNELVQTCKRKR